MGEIILIAPTAAYAEEIMQFRRELSRANDTDCFAGCGSLKRCETYAEWQNWLDEHASAETCPPGGVPSNTYLAVRRTDNRIVGIIDLRHHIDHPILGLWGGHMGYSVRPSERRKGYAKEMLRLNLENCRARGMERILITCSPDNPASEKTILANGGVFEKDITVDGETVRRYWITL